MKYKNTALVEALIKDHGDALLRFLARRMRSMEDAEDIAQTTFEKLYSLDDPDKLDNPKAFLFQVAANLSIDQLRRETLRRNHRDQEIKQGLGEEGEIRERDPDLERTLEAQEQLELIYRSLSDLPMNVRQAFILNRERGMTYPEIASQLGVSVSSVEKYILQALKALRTAVNPT